MIESGGNERVEQAPVSTRPVAAPWKSKASHCMYLRLTHTSSTFSVYAVSRTYEYLSSTSTKKKKSYVTYVTCEKYFCSIKALCLMIIDKCVKQELRHSSKYICIFLLFLFTFGKVTPRGMQSESRFSAEIIYQIVQKPFRWFRRFRRFKAV